MSELPRPHNLDVPYFITRVVPALYHVILLPADLGESDLHVFAQAQTHANRLDGCVVLAEHRAIYIHANGRTTASDTPPSGGAIVAGNLAPAIEFLESDELRVRREQLDALVEGFRSRGGFLLGDLTKGGCAATADELRRLEGVNEDGVPVGLKRCLRCREWRGTCLDPSEQFRGQIMQVHCRCQNHNRCARCGQHLYRRRLNANFYEPADGQIWHVPGFSGLNHRCAGASSRSPCRFSGSSSRRAEPKDYTQLETARAYFRNST